MTVITRIVAFGEAISQRVQYLFAPKREATPEPSLNRAQRRALARIKPGELRMRRERTFIAQAKRRSSTRGDHGAKSKRAFNAGIEQAVRYLNVRIQQAYVQGLKEGRAQGGLLRRFATKSRAFVSRASLPVRKAAQ